MMTREKILSIPGDQIRQEIPSLRKRFELGVLAVVQLTHYRKPWGYVVSLDYGEALELAHGAGRAAAAIKKLIGIAAVAAARGDEDADEFLEGLENGQEGDLLAGLAKSSSPALQKVGAA